ncbi:MAG TPA: histidine phosphatase family protein, partial [Anaerolineales bacterium]|nr:histidine phosphatase family protein [Anaerolineales bacterium]
MKLYLIRHGLAYEPGTPGYEDDVQRPLTDKGRDKLSKIFRSFKDMNPKPDVVLCSPYLRARQTAELFAKELKFKKEKVEFSDLLIPTGKPEPIISEIIEKYLVEELVLIGHEPCLGLLISMLTAGDLDLAINLKYG